MQSPIVSISSWPHNTDHTLCGESAPPLESLPPPQQLLQFRSQKHGLADTRAHPHPTNTHPTHTVEHKRRPPSPTSHEHAEVLASSFSAPKMSMWLLPLVILMSTPGSPLLVTPANAMATSHANMPPRHDPLIPAIWLWEHGTTHALFSRGSKKSLLISSYLTRAPVENVTSSVRRFILTDFILCLFVL